MILNMHSLKKEAVGVDADVASSVVVETNETHAKIEIDSEGKFYCHIYQDNVLISNIPSQKKLQIWTQMFLHQLISKHQMKLMLKSRAMQKVNFHSRIPSLF